MVVRKSLKRNKFNKVYKKKLSRKRLRKQVKSLKKNKRLRKIKKQKVGGSEFKCEGRSCNLCYKDKCIYTPAGTCRARKDKEPNMPDSHIKGWECPEKEGEQVIYTIKGDAEKTYLYDDIPKE